MEIASLADIKKELKTLSQNELLDICLRLARYKKENKELLNYLLFEAGNEEKYIASIKEEVVQEFQNMNSSNLYLAKKSIRRILRILKRYIKYSENKETEVELLIFFCEELKEQNLPLQDSKVLMNLYQRQLITIKKVLKSLHEDLQFDYQERIMAL